MASGVSMVRCPMAVIFRMTGINSYGSSVEGPGGGCGEFLAIVLRMTNHLGLTIMNLTK